MNTITSIPATPPAKAPARSADPAADNRGAPAEGFAALLDQSMAPPARPHDERAPDDRSDGAAAGAGEPEQARPRADAQHKSAPKPQRRDDKAAEPPAVASAARAHVKPQREGEAIAVDGEDKPGRPRNDKHDAKDDPTPLTPGALPAAAPPMSAALAAATDAPGAERPAALAHRAAVARLAANAAADAATADAPRTIKGLALDARPAALAQAQEARRIAEPAVTSAAEASADALPLAAPTSAPLAPRASEALPQAHVAAAVDTPAFAPALATQVRWLVEGGVQLAQLTLNPAEMGPVSVQIALDGAQARIDFSAEVALTRSAIESSLPTLAAALAANGIALAGGGVFDGTPRRQPGEPGANGRGSAQGASHADEARLDAAMHATRVGAPARGLVDLVA